MTVNVLRYGLFRAAGRVGVDLRIRGILILMVCALFLPSFLPAEAAEFTNLCRTGTPQQIRQAVQKGAKLNTRDSKGELPLIAALTNKAAAEVLQILVRSGARVGAKNASGLTALHAAVLRYPPELTVELLRLKADANADGGDIGSPLMAALLREPIDPQLVNLLIQTGANVNFTDNGGLTPLIQAIAVKASPEVLTLLLKNGAEVDKTSPKIGNETPLMIAAGYSPAPIVKVLLDAGASTTAKNASGKAAKDYAVEAKMAENLKLITDQEKAQPGEAAFKATMPKGASLPPPVVVDLEAIAGQNGDIVSAPKAEAPVETEPQASPAPKPAPEETKPAPATPQRPTPTPRAEMPSRSGMSGLFAGMNRLAWAYIFLGCCLGYWAGPLIVLRKPLSGMEYALCSLVLGITTTLLTSVSNAEFVLHMGLRSPIVALLLIVLCWLICSVVNGAIFKVLVRHPRTGDRVKLKEATLTAFVALMFTQSMALTLGLTRIFAAMGQYLFVLIVFVFALSSYFCYYLAGRMVLQVGPPLKELLTCVFVMGMVGGLLWVILSFGGELFYPLLAEFIMMLLRLPPLLAWIIGMALLTLILTLIAVPVVGRTMFNPIDGSRLQSASAFRIGLLGSVFHVLVLRVLLFLVTSSIASTLAPMMRGRF